MYAEVAIEYPVKSLDKSFTYLVPKDFYNTIKVGMKVMVPFGNKVLNGIVTQINDIKPDYDIKPIKSLENTECILNEEQMDIASFLQKETLCTMIAAYQTMLPPALKIKTQDTNYDKYDIYVELNSDINIENYIKSHQKAHKQIEIIDALRDGKKLKKDFPNSTIRILIDNEIVKLLKEKKYRLNAGDVVYHELNLNEEQQKAFDSVYSNVNKYKVFLLQGVTGSGKTEVYMHLIHKIIESGKTALVLVPEICLTTQTVKRFYDRFGSDVAVFHSGLSSGEKYDEYLKIYRNEVKIVVGTRSSIFVPLRNIGIIIIDEEHSDTYKQDSNPRYDAIEVAKFRAEYHKCPVVLASATPSLESRARAMKGVYQLLTLNKRANKMTLPKVSLVDMTSEIRKRNLIFSDELKEKIKDRLEKKEQIILLLNRRGFSTFITCGNCGYTYKCPNCDITLTYHKTSNNLRCHYCGYNIKKDELCPNCHENALNYLGLGTQKLEEELYKLFPEAKIIRMDQDTTSKKGSFQRIIDEFASEKYNILLGTQMISKGLDFKNVTLVGVINADTSLNIPDFRASERTFDLLYQTAGRAGRDAKQGEVIIQTFNPDNDILNFVKVNDYESFFDYEMGIRHKLKYPPYTYIVSINLKSSDYNLASSEANNVKKYLDTNIDHKSVIFGPTPASVFKVNNIYNFQIIIKYTYDDKLKLALKKLDALYATNNKVNLEITFNPSRF